MDLKRVAQKTGLGDGPDAKRALSVVAVEEQQEHEHEPEEHEQQEQDKYKASGLDENSSDSQTDCMQLDGSKDTDCDSLKAERGSMSPSSHVAPYTGNGCAPSLESFMFQQTPAGSQLCSWMSRTESGTSTNDVSVQSELDKDCKQTTQSVKLNRKEQNNLRRLNALRALALERELSSKTPQAPTLLIRFPDPKITANTVSEYSQSIRDVVFPASVTQRYCLVHLKAGVNIESAVEEINQVRFGNGHLHAELKEFTDEEQAECIDPCSLYVSNIPFNMNAADIKTFVNSMRVDIGVMKRQKRARYAFVRYGNPELAMEAFRDLISRTVSNRVLTVRYRRLRKRFAHPTATSLCISNQTIDTLVTDDDAAECQLISPPPVESITIVDSDDEQIDSTLLKKRISGNRESAPDEEFQRLKQEVAEHAAFIQSLRKDAIVNASTKVEPQLELSADKSVLPQRSHLPCSSYEIKIENDYLGIAQGGTPETEPQPQSEFLPEGRNDSPYRRTTCPIDGIEAPVKSSDCFGWLISGLGRRKSTKSNAPPAQGSSSGKDDNLDMLYAQLENEFDA